MKRKCMEFWMIFILLLAVGLSGCADKWQTQYDLGVKYLSEGNYEEAVIAFTAAIEIDEKKPEAYISLAEVSGSGGLGECPGRAAAGTGKLR